MALDQNNIEIELSKMKILLLAAQLLSFSLLGWILLYFVEYTLLKIILMSTFSLYFIIIAIAFIKQLFSKSPGLIIDPNGVTDNSGLNSVGFIPWSDIMSIKGQQILGRKYILLTVKDPNKYIKSLNVHNKLNNWEIFGLTDTPIYFSAMTLDIEHEELLSALRNYQKRE